MQTAANRPNKNELSQLLLRYLPYWPYFLVSLIVCGILAEVYLHFATPVYQISAAILIKEDNKENNNPASLSLNLFSTKKIVDNETELLHSRTIMDEVVKKLGLYAPVSQAGRLHNMSAYTASPVSIELKSPDSLKETKQKVFFTYDNNGKVILTGGQRYPLNSWTNSPWGIIKFIPNIHYAVAIPPTKKEKLFFSLVSVYKVADDLLKNLEVVPSSKLSTVINLSVKDPVPQRGEDILNELIGFYNLENLKDKDKLTANSLAFLDERLRYVSTGLDSIETDLQQFKANKGVVNLSEQGKLMLGTVETNDQKISEINVQLAVLRQIETSIKENSGSPGIIPSTGGINDEVLSSYLNNLYNAEIQYDQLSKTTAQNNPILLSLKNQIDKIRPTVLQYVHNQISMLETSKTNLQATTGQYSSMMRKIPKKEREMLEINRQQDIKNNLYTYLLQKREEVALAHAATVSGTRIVDSAQAGAHPVDPKRMVVLGFGFILGLGIPVFFLLFNKKILSKEEIAEILDFPIIGEISNAGTKKRIIMEDDKKGFITEQFRQVRTSLASLTNIKSQKTILITSSIAGEGKSFTALNLGYSLALVGKKVIVLELDLRKPRLSQLFNLSNRAGIVDFLKGNADIDEIICNTAINGKLSLIPAGELPPNPSELLLNGKLAGLLAYLEDIYDAIILETTPVGLFTDGYNLSEMCDVTLLLVRYMVTPKSELVLLKESLKVRDLKNPVIIFNGVKKIGAASYSSKYYSYMSRHEKLKRERLTKVV